MSYATFRDISFHFESEQPGFHFDAGTASTSVRYTLDSETARKFKLRRSNATSLRLAGTKQRRAPSK